MITQGLSHHELSLITKILDEHKAQYHVDAAGGADEVKVRGGRGDTSFYQIDIPGDQYNKLPAQAKSKLENLGIYPEMEAPDFSEESPQTKTPADATRVRNNMKKFEKILIVILAAMALSFVARVLKNQ